MDEIKKFRLEVAENIRKLREDEDLQALSRKWVRATSPFRYSYNFSWLGRPIIQFPQDVLAMQEIIWNIKPDGIIETGVAHGGSLVLYASLLELLGGDRKVLGVDVDIRTHNRREIESHPLSHRIQLVQGSSIDEDTVRQVAEFARNRNRILVVLDSNHTHEHVLRELQLYSPFVDAGSYLVVFDTIVEDMPDDFFPDRPWGKGNNPKTAVREFLLSTDRFVVDRDIEAKLLITVAPEGYLKCVKGLVP